MVPKGRLDLAIPRGRLVIVIVEIVIVIIILVIVIGVIDLHIGKTLSYIPGWPVGQVDNFC